MPHHAFYVLNEKLIVGFELSKVDQNRQGGSKESSKFFASSQVLIFAVENV